MSASDQLDLFREPAADDFPSLGSRALGGFAGFACGDALGATGEQAARGRRETVTEIAAEPTERTALALATAESILASPADPLRGAGTPRLRRRTAESTDSAALPRALPAALAYSDLRTLLVASARLTATTHWDPQAEVTSAVYALWIRELLAGADRYGAWRRALRTARDYEAGGALALDTPGPRPLPDRFWSRLEDVTDLAFGDLQPSGYAGYCLECLEAAAWCAIFADDAEQAVVDAVNLGGASASLGALAGAAAGVFWGVEGLPERWLARLGELDRIARLACDLAAIRA